MSDIFDQLASGNNSPQTQSSAVPQSQTQQASQPVQVVQGQPAQEQGDIFTQLAANPQQSSAPATPAVTVSATPGSMPGDSLPSKLTLWAQNLHSDLMHGTGLTDIGRLYKSIGGQPLANGQGEGVGEFMGSPVLGPTRMLQGAGELPQTGRRWQGTKDVVGGTLDALQIPGSFVSPEVGELAGVGTDAALTQAERAAKATGRAVAEAPSRVRNAFSLQAVQDALENAHADIQKGFETSTKAIQDDWHQTVRDIFSQAAQDADVTPEKAGSLHDLAANLSDAVKAKAQALYRQADAAVGGTHFQNYQTAVRNIRNQIYQQVGIDPEVDAQLQQRLADAQAGHDAAKEAVTERGLDPGIIETADNLYRRAMSLKDLSKPMQASISGLRSDLQGAGAAAVESLSPAKLAARANALFDKGRLQTALGEGGASDFLTAIESTKQRLKDAAIGMKQQVEAAKSTAARQTAAVNTKRVAAGAALGATLGGVPGYALVKHLLGF